MRKSQGKYLEMAKVHGADAIIFRVYEAELNFRGQNTAVVTSVAITPGLGATALEQLQMIPGHHCKPNLLNFNNWSK